MTSLLQPPHTTGSVLISKLENIRESDRRKDGAAFSLSIGYYTQIICHSSDRFVFSLTNAGTRQPEIETEKTKYDLCDVQPFHFTSILSHTFSNLSHGV